MAYQLDGKSLPLDVAFSHNDINYPANWLRLSTADEKTAIGVSEITDPTNYDGRFYNLDGSAKSLVDIDATYEEDDPDGTYSKGDLIKNPDGTQLVYYGVKSTLIETERGVVSSLLARYDWYVTRKSEKGIAIPDAIVTYRDGVRTAYETRKTEIDNCGDTAALVTLYDRKEDGTLNMTQYPDVI